MVATTLTRSGPNLVLRGVVNPPRARKQPAIEVERFLSCARREKVKVPKVKPDKAGRFSACPHQGARRVRGRALPGAHEGSRAAGPAGHQGHLHAAARRRPGLTRREPDPCGGCSRGVRELLAKEAPVRRVLFALPVALVLLIAPAAHAGGWATVGLSSTPAGTEPGTPWPVKITVLQHGVTPLEGVEPAVIITSGDARKTFAAKPDRQARRVPRRGRVPGRRPLGATAVVDGFDSSGHAAHVPGGDRSRSPSTSPASPAPASADGGGTSIRRLASCPGVLRCCSRRAAMLAAPARRRAAPPGGARRCERLVIAAALAAPVRRGAR